MKNTNIIVFLLALIVGNFSCISPEYTQPSWGYTAAREKALDKYYDIYVDELMSSIKWQSYPGQNEVDLTFLVFNNVIVAGYRDDIYSCEYALHGPTGKAGAKNYLDSEEHIRDILLLIRSMKSKGLIQ